jgi:hypothetical protein
MFWHGECLGRLEGAILLDPLNAEEARNSLISLCFSSIGCALQSLASTLIAHPTVYLPAFGIGYSIDLAVAYDFACTFSYFWCASRRPFVPTFPWPLERPDRARCTPTTAVGEYSGHARPATSSAARDPHDRGRHLPPARDPSQATAKVSVSERPHRPRHVRL